MLLKYKNLEELESSIKLDLASYEKCKTNMIINAMKQLNQVGKKHFEHEAKEDAYCHFYRYMTLMTLVLKSNDFRRNQDLYKNDLSEATNVLEKLELLKDDLIKVYKEQQDKTEIDKKLPAVEPATNLPAQTPENILKSPAILVNNNYWIGLDRLIECIKIGKKDFSYIILDTRPADDYKRSHLYYHECHNINVPMDKLTTGYTVEKMCTSAAMVEKILDDECKEIWRNRTAYNFIILMGQMDSLDKTLSSTTERLLNVITKWDPNTQYKHAPIILDGGYMNFIFKYPTYFTAAVDTTSDTITGDDLLLNSIDYPTLIDLTVDDLETPEIEKVASRIVSIPTFDRSKKPVYNFTAEIETTDLDSDYGPSEDLTASENDVLDLETRTETSASPEIEMPRPKRELKDRRQHSDQKIVPNNAVRNNSKISKHTRVSEKIDSVPFYDRSKKPKVVKPRYDPSRYSPKHGQKVLGCVGFTNTSNICYVNAIIQILLNLKELRDYLLGDAYLDHIKTTTTSKGNICQELAQICDMYWRKNCTIINIKPLKERIGRLNSRFARDTQEDSHEFFMILIHYLHEELSYSITVDDDASESLAKFYQYMNYKKSFISENFFGQSQTYVHCHTCGYTSATYTPFGCLTLEIAGATLEDCIAEHYHAEEVDDFRCEKCNFKGTVTKKTSIYTAPQYLTIHLKRFKETSLRTYNKNCDPVAFPLRLNLAIVNEDAESVVKYDLVGVCVHTGQINQGHYRAYVNKSQLNGNWILFDDSHVTPVKSLLAVRAIYSDVYMLFYNKV